jgi:Glycosyl transferase family 2
VSVTLTIGMATHCGWEGVWATVQALRFYQDLRRGEVEFVICDNAPETPHGAAVKNLLTWLGEPEGIYGRYIPCGESQGTSAPRQRIFEESAAEWVLCMDDHVLLAPGSIRRLLSYLRRDPGSLDLLSGPMLYDDLRTQGTHWADVWRDKMWGTREWDLRSRAPNAKPFEIFANGLGVFAMRREAWPGFNSRFRGFGGEECYIHEKVRRAGGKCLCLPWLRWAHRTNDFVRVPYPLFLEHRARNYIIGHRELGLDLERCRACFVDEAGQSEDWFSRLVQDVDLGLDEKWETGPYKPAVDQGGAMLPPGLSLRQQIIAFSRIELSPEVGEEPGCQSST